MKLFIRKMSKLTLASVCIGSLVGIFQLCAKIVIDFAMFLLSGDLIGKIVFMGLVIASSFIARFFTLREPSSLGSGLPQMELVVRNKYSFSPLRNTMAAFISCMCSFFSLLSLGSEGPSVELGGSVGMIVEKTSKSNKIPEMIPISCACGFSCAFLSPLAGFFYAFEEVFHKWDKRVFFETAYMILISYFVTILINRHLFISFEVSTYLPIWLWYIILVLIVLNVGFGTLFTYLIVFLNSFFSKTNSRIWTYRGVLVFAISGLIAVFWIDLSGSGVNMIKSLENYQAISIISLLLLIKMIFTIVSSNVPTSGGLLIPMMSIGAIIGYLVVLFFNMFLDFPLEHADMIIIISMLMFFTNVTHSKWTAFGLSITFAPFQYIALPALIGIFGVWLLTRLTKIECIYEYLMRNFLTKYKYKKSIFDDEV